jgi:hypothetical protein
MMFKKLIPCRSDVLGVLSGGVAWAIVAIGQSYEVIPCLYTAAPRLTNWLKAVGVLKSGFFYAGQPGVDPIAGFTLVIVAIWASHSLSKHCPSKRELALMEQTVAAHREVVTNKA